MSPDDDATLFDEPPVFDGGLMHVSHRARADSNGYDASRGNAWALPDPEIFRDKLSLPGWLEREVKLPDCLMGEWLTTTCLQQGGALHSRSLSRGTYDDGYRGRASILYPNPISPIRSGR